MIKLTLKSTLVLALVTTASVARAQNPRPAEAPTPPAAAEPTPPPANPEAPVAPAAPDAPVPPGSGLPPAINPEDPRPAGDEAPAEPPMPPPVLAQPRVIAVEEGRPEDSLGGSSDGNHVGTPFKGAVRAYVDGSAVWNLDDRYHLFEDSDVNVRLGVSVGYDLLRFEPGWVVSPELGWSRESAEGGPRSAEFTRKELTADHFFAAFRARHALFSWLEGFGRLQGGVAWSRVELDASTASYDQYAGEDVAPEFQLGAGISGLTPDSAGARPGEGLALGALLEGGYQLAPEMALNLERRSSRDGQRFSVLAADLGEVSRSGPYLRFGAFLRF